MFDVAVIGGGASGMAAAITAARGGCRVVVLEAQQRLGRKLLATGNGRCNIANTGMRDGNYHTSSPDLAKDILNRVPLGDVIDFFAGIGITMIEDGEGRLYPRSEQASSVLDMLRAELSRLGVELRTECRVNEAVKSNGFTIKLQEESIKANKLILAAGGMAAPELGGCGDGIALLHRLGHSPVDFRPSLTPLRVKSEHLRALKGVRVKCAVTLLSDGKPVRRETGELQFTDTALSGIAIFQLSAEYARLRGGAEVSVDLFPEISEDELRIRMLARKNELSHLTAEEFLAGLVQKRVGICIMKSAGVGPLNTNVSNIHGEKMEIITKSLKDWRFAVEGSGGWRSAQVSAGGLPLSELDGRLQSKRCPGLYVCGELLDADGDCGGHNLRWAWSTGILAGRSACGGVLR